MNIRLCVSLVRLSCRCARRGGSRTLRTFTYIYIHFYASIYIIHTYICQNIHTCIDNMYIYVLIYLYTCMYIYIYTHLCKHVYIYGERFKFVYMFIVVGICICLCICICTCRHMYVHARMYAHIHIYLHTQT